MRIIPADLDSRQGVLISTHGLGTINIKDDLIRDFPIESAQMAKDIQTYWETHVEKYFSKSKTYPNPHLAHKLRKACVVNLVGKQGTTNGLVTVELAEIFDDGFEYGKVVMKGRREADHHIFVPSLGRSIDTEQISFGDKGSYVNRKTTKGVSNAAWNAWTKDFNAYVRQRTREFVRQCIRKGLFGRKK